MPGGRERNWGQGGCWGREPVCARRRRREPPSTCPHGACACAVPSSALTQIVDGGRDAWQHALPGARGSAASGLVGSTRRRWVASATRRSACESPTRGNSMWAPTAPAPGQRETPGRFERQRCLKPAQPLGWRGYAGCRTALLGAGGFVEPRRCRQLGRIATRLGLGRTSDRASQTPGAETRHPRARSQALRAAATARLGGPAQDMVQPS